MPSEAQTRDVHAASHAMLSVYYQTVGRQFEVRGAPAVFLPPEVQPMSLSDALDVLKRDAPDRLREALWRIVRSVPAIQNASIQKSVGFGGAQTYPTAMLPYLNGEPLKRLIELRRGYRQYANLFSAALIACRDGEPKVFKQLLDLLGEPERQGVGFSRAESRILGQELLPRLGIMLNAQNSDHPKKVSGQIARIETEIGCSIQEFVEGIADAAAFDEIMDADDMRREIPRLQTLENLSVYPLCSVIRQNTQSLVTSATSTAIVGAPFEDICKVVNPANWERAGSIINKACFVSGPFDFKEVDPPVFGDGKPGVLHEYAEISWSGRSDQTAQFENVLNVVSSVWEPAGDSESDGVSNQLELRSAEVRYNLCRSINSTVLWDRRPGGLLVNQGFIKVRPIGEQIWQVTMRKEVQFSDRTPDANGRGWRDFGQLSNYLAPATLTWWLECETYRDSEDTVLADQQPVHANGDPRRPNIPGAEESRAVSIRAMDRSGGQPLRKWLTRLVTGARK